MISSGAISDLNGMLPAMKITEPYSPTPRAKASAKPVASAGSDGRQDHPDEGLQPVRAERQRGFLDVAAETAASTGSTVRTTKGRPMKASATTMPCGL